MTMNYNIINILVVGGDIADNFTQSLKTACKDLTRVKVKEIETVHTLADVDREVHTNKFDIVLAFENINNNESIGAGSIRAWLKANPDIRVIVIVTDKQRLYSNKFFNLFKEGYYDAIYTQDMDEELEPLLARGRSELEAYNYYQLEKREKKTIEQAINEVDTVKPDKESVVTSEETIHTETFDFNNEEENEEVLFNEPIIAPNPLDFKAETNESIKPDKNIKEEIEREERMENKNIKETNTNEENLYPAESSFKKYLGINATIEFAKGNSIFLDLGNGHNIGNQLIGKKVTILIAE